MSKLWVIYDGRAELGDTEDASVMEAMTSLRDVKRAIHFWRDHDAVLFEYDTNEKNNEATNERLIGHFREGRKLLELCSSDSKPGQQS